MNNIYRLANILATDCNQHSNVLNPIIGGMLMCLIDAENRGRNRRAARQEQYQPSWEQEAAALGSNA